MAKLFFFVFFTLFIIPVLPGCFDPDIPDTAFRCGENGECPDGYECREDGCCHKIGIPYEPSPGCRLPDATIETDQDGGPDDGWDGSADSGSDPDDDAGEENDHEDDPDEP